MGDSGTVYIVDDDASVRRSLKRLLESAGYSVETFASAGEFIAFERQGDGPSCLILDVKMPGKSGLELQEALSGPQYSIPIIFISGHGDIADSVRAMKRGALDFLPKPFDDEELLASVGVALQTDMNNKASAIERQEIMQRFKSLTPREYEIMTYVISGMLNKQIAASLNIGEKTVKVHRARVLAKTGVASVAELVRMTEQLGIKPAPR
jgi:FixJ family two-component response regulator